MDLQKFFIVGCPRSGTTLVQQALNRHTRIAIPPETAFFSFIGLSQRRQKNHWQRINADLAINLTLPRGGVRGVERARRLYDELARRYLERFDSTRVTHFGEKTPEHLYRLQRIAQVFPLARTILIYRDGRDVAVRLFGLPWTSRDLYVNFALWLYCCRLQRLAERHNNPTLLTVRYENLVREPEREFRRILDFLGLPFEPQVVDGYGNAAGIAPWECNWKSRALRPIADSRIGLWQQSLTRHEVGILESWGGRTLRNLGYELTTDGRQALPWHFYPRVAWLSFLWLARRPGYAAARSRWLDPREANGPSAFDCRGDRLPLP